MRNLALVILLLCSVAHADDAPADALVLAQVCYLEAGFSAPDCAAIWHVGVRRGRTRDQAPIDALRAYSVPYRRPSARGAIVRTWPAHDIHGATARHNRAWRSLRSLAVRLIRGEIPDPCPAATEWNDRDSQPRGRMVRVCEGLTENRLYAVRERERR